MGAAEMVLLILNAAIALAALIVANFLLRTVIVKVLMFFGAFDPRWDRYWPRLPWRFVWRALVGFVEWKEENFSGGEHNAGRVHWLTQLATPYRTGYSLIGRLRLPFGIGHYFLVGEPTERHKVFVASARSGKSVQLETEISLMPDDAAGLFTDPKGTITENVCYYLEARGHELCVLDPLGCTSRPSQSINIHRQIDFINHRLGDDRTTMLFDRYAAMHFPPDSNEKEYFKIAGKEGWARLNCFAKWYYPDSSPLHARHFLMHGFIEHADGDSELAMTMLWKAMERCPIYNGYVSSFGTEMLNLDHRTRSSVLSTMKGKTAYLDHPQVRAVSHRNDLNLCDLKDPTKNLIITLPAPVGDMRTTLRPWIGAITSLSLAVMEWIPGDLRTKTRFVIEEAQALGEQALPGLGDTAALMAGMGVQLIVVVQGMSGFRKAFPRDYQSIIGNAQHVVFMATNEPETYDFIAEKAFGEKTVKRRKWGFLWVVERRTEPFITPDKVRRYLESERGNAIVMRNGKRSMIVKIAKSFEVLPVWMIRPDRMHGETASRAWFRARLMRARAGQNPTNTEIVT